MEHYKNFARDKGLMRSTYGGNSGAEDGGKMKAGMLRTSKQTWLEEYDKMSVNDSMTSIGPYMVRADVEQGEVDTVAMGVSSRIMLGTGLYARYQAGGESYQVANYGLGGYYNHHPDPHMWHHRDIVKKDDIFTRGEELMMGDRLATFMGYLSKVEMGGGTAFPNVGVSVAAEKGSAVFWWNLLSNGLLDSRTVHGGCPVLVGSKWITNKWIHWKHQQLKMPCIHQSIGAYSQQPLSNKMCSESDKRCDISNEIFYDNQVYFSHLRQFSPDFE